MEPRRGRTVVLVVLGFAVFLAGLLGFLLGATILPSHADGALPPAEVGPVAFPITPLSLALYGVVTVGVAAVVVLALVVHASRAERGASEGRW